MKKLVVSQPTAPASSGPRFFDVIDIAWIGIEIYTYLQPGDLCRLGMTNEHIRSEISDVRVDVLRSFLPIHLVDDKTNDSVTLSEGHTFTSREEVQDFLVRRLDAAEVLVRGTHTREESTERAKYLLNIQNWCNLTVPEHIFSKPAKCHLDEIDAENASERLVSSSNECRGVTTQHPHKHAFVVGWMRYLLAETGVECKGWDWISSHPNFTDQSSRGTGLMITRPRGRETIEMKWDKKYKPNRSIFEQIPRARRIRQQRGYVRA